VTPYPAKLAAIVERIIDPKTIIPLFLKYKRNGYSDHSLRKDAPVGCLGIQLGGILIVPTFGSNDYQEF
jgi:hypothetical protein